MYQYPYGNAQQLNLDWILSKLQELESGSGGGADLEEVANALVSASFDAGVQYRRYDYCFYNGKLYRALNDNSGAFNPSDWLEVVIGDDIPVLTRLLNAVDASLTSLQDTVNDLDSDDIDNASNVTGTTVTDALDNLDASLTTLQGQVADLDSDDVDNASNVTGTTVTDALDNLNGALGDVADDVIELQNHVACYEKNETLSNRWEYAYGAISVNGTRLVVKVDLEKSIGNLTFTPTKVGLYLRDSDNNMVLGNNYDATSLLTVLEKYNDYALSLRFESNDTFGRTTNSFVVGQVILSGTFVE